MIRKYVSNILYALVFLVVNLMLSRILIFEYSIYCLEGKVVEGVQLVILLCLVIMSLRYLKNYRYICFLFFSFLFFEEINWGYDFFPQVIKNIIVLDKLPFYEKNFSFHNMYGHKIEEICTFFLMLILICPEVFTIIPYIKKRKYLLRFPKLKQRMYVFSILLVYEINARNSIIKTNKYFEHANEEYFELMLYFWFLYLLVKNITMKK